MTIETEVAALTTQTAALLSAVNVAKATLDTKVSAASASAATATSQASTATTQASNAVSQAASAVSSAAQAVSAKDLAITAWSASTAPAENLAAISKSIHFGAVVKSIIYDTSKDSDGGAWRKRCQDKSWFTEALGFTGTWRNQLASAAAAWAVTGAAAGDGYQNTTDGKFYALSGTNSQTEIFRGNVREFPAQLAIKLEAGRLIGYDLTQVGCPMWMVFVGNTTGAQLRTITATALAALNGNLLIGSSSDCLFHFSFLADRALWVYANGSPNTGYMPLPLSGRNVAQVRQTAQPYNLANLAVNDIALTILDNAPIDPATGLPVPTIAVATAGGLSTLTNAGTVINSAVTTSVVVVDFDGSLLKVVRSDGVVALYDDAALLGVSPSGTLSAATIPAFLGVVSKSSKGSKGSSLGLTLVRRNPSVPAKSMVAHITRSYTSGWQVGDIRRAYLCENDAVAVGPAVELATGDSGSFSAGIGNWSANGNTVTASGGIGTFTVPSAYVSSFLSLSVTIGRVYRVTVTTAAGTTGVPLLYLDNDGGRILPTASSAAYLVTALASTLPIQVTNNTNGGICKIDSVSVIEVVADRSVKAGSATIFGTLTKTAVATAAQLVAYGGWSAANYLQEPYSANMDFGTGEWDVGAWVNTPATLPASSFPVVGAELVTNGTFDANLAGWTAGNSSAMTNPSGRLRVDTAAPFADSGTATAAIAPTAGKCYLVKFDLIGANNIGTIEFGGVTTLIPGPVANSGSKSMIVKAASSGGLTFRTNTPSAGYYIEVDNVSLKEIGLSVLVDRSAATGSSINLGIDGAGFVKATAFDGTTTRSATSPASINTGLATLVGATYRTDGSLALTVNGAEVAKVTGTPLLTMTNTAAVLTIGNSRLLDAPFPGSLSLLAIGATAPSADQSAFICRTELPLLQPGAQCTLDGTSTAITAMAFDDSTDLLHVGTSWGRSTFRNLLRVESAVSLVGSITSLAASQGAHITAGASGGRYYQPAMLLRDELRRREDARKALGKVPVFFELDTASFTSPTTSGSASLTASSVVGTPYVGMGITGTGIPAGATIIAINGTAYTLSAAATVTNAGAVALAQSSFVLQQGYTAKAVYSAGALKRIGSTKDYTVSQDGFRESVVFGVSPGSATWVSVMAVRSN